MLVQGALKLEVVYWTLLLFETLDWDALLIWKTQLAAQYLRLVAATSVLQLSLTKIDV